MIVRDDGRARDFINAAIGACIAPPSFGWVAVDDSGVAVGAILVNNFSGFDIHISGAGKVGTAIVRAVARAIFVNLGCSRVTAVTRASNTAAQRFVRGLGFQFEANLPAQYGEEDGLQFRLLRRDQRLVRIDHDR